MLEDRTQDGDKTPPPKKTPPRKLKDEQCGPHQTPEMNP